MISSPFFRRLLLPYLLLVWASIGLVGFVAAVNLRDSYLEQARQGLSSRTALVARLIDADLRAGRSGALDALLRDAAAQTGDRVTVIAADGKVLADSEADPAQMESHRDRPEVRQADAQGEGSQLRTSATLREPMLYVARRIGSGEGSYFVRVSAHVRQLDRALAALYAGLATAALLAMAGAGLICYLFARRQSRPVLDLTEFANALARGELGRRYLRDERGEVGTLATALNAMADSLVRLLAQARDDNERLLTILASMNEGVIAADCHQQILLSNKAAGRVLGFDPSRAPGKALWEVVRNDAILKCAGEALAGLERKTIAVGPLAGRHLEVTACTFPAGRKPEGLILVAHDTTQSVQYQELRKEFVANVSHELRTPLSIIKGFAETLRDGAMNEPARARKYLQTIEKHADQLTNLVNDLLELSKLDSLPGLTRSGPIDLPLLLRRVGELLMPAAQKKRHQLRLSLPDRMPTLIGNGDYIERAVTNLVDNAIKYTPEEGRIDVAARQENGSVVVEVSDNGIGISEEELPRIFERFYRVDRSRSRELGGTGLGLSIVKHVAHVHGGAIDVTSTPGAGTCFRLRFPLIRPAMPPT